MGERVAALEMQKPPAARTPQTRIFVVEDDKRIAADLKRSLESMGYIVPAVAPSGEEAIHKVEELRPQLVLMDIVLNGRMDGIEAARIIHKRFQLPIVYLTAYADELTIERAKFTEPFGYILKPFNETELYTAIETALYKHQMERKLRESEQWLHTVLNSIGDPVIATDKEERIKFLNPVAEELIQCSQADALGRPLSEVFQILDEKERMPENPVVTAIQENRVVTMTLPALLIIGNGEEIPIDGTAAPIRDRETVVGTVLVLRNVTEKRKREEELQKISRLESVGLLAGGIAHDFNNLLTCIMGNISLVKHGTESGDKNWKRLERAEQACLRAKNLTEQLLTFARGGAPIKEVVSLQELVEESVTFACRGSNILCDFEIPEDLRHVEIDTGQMKQVIHNMVINAQQAMPEGGRIFVRCANVDRDEIAGMPLSEGRYVKISIEDRGIGISPEHLGKIFDPYFTTKQRGSGLGLAICYSVVGRHGGHIAVESELGAGAAFHIYLPESEKQPEMKQAEEPEPRQADSIQARGRILLMDDEEMIRDIGASILQTLGYEVKTISDGLETVLTYQIAQRSGVPFDAVILDLTVAGGMGGKETLRRLLEIDPGAKVIVSSGYSSDPVMAQSDAHGFSAVVVKPYTIQELERTLNRILYR